MNQNDIKVTAINSAAKLLLGRQFWADCKYFVNDASGQSGLTGVQKHEKVKADLLIIFGDIGSTLIDIGIKLAVLWLQSQATSQS